MTEQNETPFKFPGAMRKIETDISGTKLANPQQHREYHAMMLRHAFEQNAFYAHATLARIKDLIVRGEYSDEAVLDLIDKTEGQI